MPKIGKRKIAAVVAIGFLASAPSLKGEAWNFRFTAPTDIALRAALAAAGKRFRPSESDQRFVRIAKLEKKRREY